MTLPNGATVRTDGETAGQMGKQTGGETGSPTARQPDNRRRKLVMTAIVTVTLLIALEGTVLNTALPIIASELGGLKLMSWVVSVYLLATAVVTPVAGKAADLYGRKVVFIVGVAIFIVSCILCGVAHNMGALIAYRALQGIGAGCIVPVTFTIVADIYPFHMRAKAQSLINAAWGVSAVASPFTGGLIVDMLSWRWIFFMNLPFGLLAMAIIWRSFHESAPKVARRMDYGGAAAFAVGLLCFMTAVFMADSGAERWQLYALYGIAALFVMLFIRLQLRSADPLVELRLFRKPIVLLPNIGDFLLHVVLVAVNFYIPLWMQGMHGYGASQSGLILLTMSVAWPVAANRCGPMIARLGMRNVAIIGALLACAATAGMAVPDWRYAPAVLCVLLFMLGSGFGLIFTVHAVSVQSAVEWARRGSAVAAHNFTRQIGQVFGITALGYVMSGSMRAYQPDGEPGAPTVADLNSLFGSHGGGQLEPELLAPLRGALDAGLKPVFVILLVLAALALIAAWLYPKKQQFYIDKEVE